MDISQLTLKLIVILIPGIIATLIYEKLTDRNVARDQFRLTLLSITFGFFCYATLQFIVFSINYINHILSNGTQNYPEGMLDVFKSLSISSSIPYMEVIGASIIALVLSYLIAALRNYHVFNWIGRKLEEPMMLTTEGQIKETR